MTGKMTMTATEVCTTQEAAQILGISVTSVQQLVESGVIEAWKTKGGHRRIPLAAVEAYKASPNAPQVPQDRPAQSKQTSILVVEDNKLQRDIYAKKIASWNLPATTTFCENGYQALVEIAINKPDIVLADIAILSSLAPEELDARGGIPEGVVFFRKPVNYDELSGYLRACCAQKARMTRS